MHKGLWVVDTPLQANLRTCACASASEASKGERESVCTGWNRGTGRKLGGGQIGVGRSLVL
jgi:hypothetical protein